MTSKFDQLIERTFDSLIIEKGALAIIEPFAAEFKGMPAREKGKASKDVKQAAKLKTDIDKFKKTSLSVANKEAKKELEDMKSEVKASRRA